MNAFNRRSRLAGFSLLELLTVMAVLGILIAVAVPSFGYLTANTQVKSASSNLHLALLKARSEAVKRDAPVTITPTSGDWKNGWQITINAGADVLLTQEALKGVAVTTAAANVVYLNSGRIQGAPPPAFTVTKLARNQSEAQQTQSVSGRCISVQANGNPGIREWKTGPCP